MRYPLEVCDICFRCFAVALVMLFPMQPLVAQQVHVYETFPSFVPTDGTIGLRIGTNQGILVIPVISQDTAFDPENNLVDSFGPNLRADLIAKFATMNQFWQEASYGGVSFDIDVLERYYQMPRELDHYFNPSYEEPRLSGTPIIGPSVDVPGGQVRLFLHITDSDEQTIDLTFDAADSPYTFAELETAIKNGSAIAGDKIDVVLDGCGIDCRRLKLAVAQIYARAGSYIHLDIPASDSAVLDALGLDRPTIVAATEQLTAVGGEYPVTTNAGDVLTLELEDEGGATQSFDWVMGNDTFNNAAEFVATHGATNPDVTVSSVGAELRFEATTTLSAAISRISFLPGSAQLLDLLGLDSSVEVDGTINFSARNTIKGDLRFIAGQALSAFLLNELTRSPGAAGPDPFNNTPIIEANEDTLNTLVATEIDPYRVVAVIFLDGPNKRAGASGNWIPIGIDNGGYRFEYMTNASIQIEFDFTDENTITHETGHNIGFPDLYNNSNGEYDPMLQYPTVWDMMHSQSRFSHPGVWAKEIDNGWLAANGAAIDSFPEPDTGMVETRQYVLTPLELSRGDYDDLLSGVPAGRTLVKAVRIPLGFGMAANDHFLLVQNRQAGLQFSQMLPQKVGAPDRGGVYVTDAISRRSFDFFKPSIRNFVHPLTDRSLVDENVSPILDSAPDMDVDFLQTYPGYDGLTVDIVGEIPGPGGLADRSSYLVDITREQKGFLELGITPWGAPPWESPDIWIEHGDKAVPSNVPLSGNGEQARWAADYDPAANGGRPLNWIRVQVTNSGTVDAEDVQIRVRVNTPGGMGDSGSWTALPLSDSVDIPSRASRILQVGWNPRVNSHTCVQAEVFRWTAPLGDRNPWNNRTQENVNSFFPTSNSPWGSTPFSFDISNGRDFPMDVIISPENLPRGLIVTLDRAFVHVPAKSKVTVGGVLELDSDIIPPPFGGGQFRDDFYKPRTRLFHIAGFVNGDEFQVPIGGISYLVFPSRRTDLDVDVTTDAAGNVVVTGTTSPPAPGQGLEIQVRYPSGRFVWIPATTDGSGNIDESFPPEEDGNIRVIVRYPGGAGFAPTDSGEELVDTTEGPGTAGFENQFGLFVGGLLTDDDLPLNSGFDVGFNYRRRHAARWSWEVEAGLTSMGSPGIVNNDDSLLAHATVHYVLHFRGRGKIEPFALLGAGLYHWNGLGQSDTSIGVAGGFGADFRWKRSIGFRADVRYLWLDDLIGSGSTGNWQIQWGPTFSF